MNEVFFNIIFNPIYLFITIKILLIQIQFAFFYRSYTNIIIYHCTDILLHIILFIRNENSL